MGLKDQGALAIDPEFRGRVQLAIVRYALGVMSEKPDETFHSARAALARRILDDPIGYGVRMAVGVATNDAITASATDGDLAAAVNTLFNAYAVT